jgi:ADP-heptose:LPS heptosyltransferase
MPDVLIKFAHGLGDCIQLSTVLRHLRKYRPDWVIDVRVGRGKESAYGGLVRRAYHDHEPEPRQTYEHVWDLGWYENYNGYLDRPNTKVTNCLEEIFRMAYDESLSRYEMGDDARAAGRAGQYLRRCGAVAGPGGRYNAFVIHYEGNTSPAKKNLGHWQAQALVGLALSLGLVPVVLDWDRRSPLPDQKTVFNPGTGEDDVWGGFGSGDAATIRALVAQAVAYVGIDSGPGKVAATTETPSLICWRGHHPVQFDQPAPNVVHLVPRHHRDLPPCGGRPELGDYFEDHYNWLPYDNEHGLVAEAQRWLCRVTGNAERQQELTGVKFVFLNGIGDTIWSLMKVKAVAAGRPVEVILSGDPRSAIDQRCLPFLRRFDFVRSAEVMDVPTLHDRHHQPTDVRGRYRYLSDGPHGGYHYLIPNAALEAGRRLEEWLPEYPVDWGVMEHFSWADTERGAQLGEALGDFAAFYLGPERGHSDEGHNLGWLWEPKHWVELGRGLKMAGLNLCVVGADYDRSFWEKFVREGVAQEGMVWHDLIGQLEIGETFALLRKARVVVSYQCGLGIVSHYLGVPVVMWWRPDGNSCHKERLVCFDERMKDGWTNPDLKDRYMGLVYGRETPGDILAEMGRRGWLP